MPAVPLCLSRVCCCCRQLSSFKLAFQSGFLYIFHAASLTDCYRPALGQWKQCIKPSAPWHAGTCCASFASCERCKPRKGPSWMEKNPTIAPAAHLWRLDSGAAHIKAWRARRDQRNSTAVKLQAPPQNSGSGAARTRRSDVRRQRMPPVRKKSQRTTIRLSMIQCHRSRRMRLMIV